MTSTPIEFMRNSIKVFVRYCHPQQAQKERAADSMLTMLRPDGEQIFNLAAACSPKRHSA